MFTGIIEALGEVIQIQPDGNNVNFNIRAPFFEELRIDQSIAHNGVCLTVVDLDKETETYTVTAIKETLDRSNLGELKPGDLVNLERSVRINERLDGHIVQGHVDQTAFVKEIKPEDGSWVYTFEFKEKPLHTLIEKGSVAINGVSLTVFNIMPHTFQVAIIPYTYEHTNFHTLQPGSKVNIEFDMIGKYIESLTAPYLNKLK